MTTETYSAFAGDQLVASGTLEPMLLGVKAYVDRGGTDRVLIFEDSTGTEVDFDLRGSPEDVLARAKPEAPRAGPGRPRLGVVSREVSLLPRHWEWLEAQPNGISAALRRLVDEARSRAPDGSERVRRAREAANRFMTAMAGDRAGYEEATRALFAGLRERFAELVRDWPRDVRAHLERTARDAF